MELIKKEDSLEGAVKYMFTVERNNQRYGIESTYLYLPQRDTKSAVCVSTQIGCAQRCFFCSSARLPFISNLTAEEIEEQLQIVTKENHPSEESKIEYAFEGMGEPLLNYESVVRTINQHQPKVGSVSFVVSTVGIVPKIYRLAQEELSYSTRLHLSLHFPTNEKRVKYIPQTKRYPIEQFLAAGKYFAESKEEKVTLNYVLISGLNDSEEDINNLLGLVDKNYFYVKLSYLNGNLPHYSPSEERFAQIKEKLEAEGITTKISANIGKRISVGCGQMVFKEIKRGK
jgi:23S rRNA (adenine2503-C2)-methyltransferase